MATLPTRRAAAAVATAGVLAVAAALVVDGPGDGPVGGAGADDVFRTPEAMSSLDARTAAGAALQASRTFYASSDAVVLAGDDEGAVPLAVEAAERLRVPLLLEHPDVREEVERLGADVVLGVGATSELPGLRTTPSEQTAVEAATEEVVRDVGVPERPDTGVVAVTADADARRAAVATARSAGADVLEVESGDPRTDPDAIAALTDRPEAAVVAIGPAASRGLAYRVESVRDDRQQPGGGLLVFPGRHVVALYGHPGTPSLGLLGEQGPQASVERVQGLVERYQRLADDPVVPAFEIIATVATAGAGDDGDFSAEADPATLEPLVDAAEEAGAYVVIDLQPGRTDFLTQAKRYRELLERPHVGLALDPEWRLRPDERHLRQVGSVSVDEVNRVGDWLAGLTRDAGLPQKMFVLHQFRTSMIRERERLDTTHPELATVVHVDGQGRQGDKQATWRVLREDAPAGLHWGWKNFIDEDEPMLTPRQTWDRVDPTPDLVTYQ